MLALQRTPTLDQYCRAAEPLAVRQCLRLDGEMNSDTSAVAAIEAVLQEHLEAVNTTDVELLLKGFTEDVVYIGTGAEPIVGKAAMREYIAPIYAHAKIALSMKAHAREISGDRAVEWGTCRGQLTLGDEEPVEVNLQYIFVYRLEPSGEWRISHDISTPGPPRDQTEG